MLNKIILDPFNEYCFCNEKPLIAYKDKTQKWGYLLEESELKKLADFLKETTDCELDEKNHAFAILDTNNIDGEQEIVHAKEYETDDGIKTLYDLTYFGFEFPEFDTLEDWEAQFKD